MELGSMKARETAIEGLAVKGVREFIMRGRGTVRRVVNPDRPNELVPVRESVAALFDGSRRKVQHGCSSPDRKTFSRDTAALQDTPLVRTELLHLNLQHLLQRFRDAEVDLVQWRGQNQSSVLLCNQPPADHVLHNRGHEKRVPARILMNQIRQTWGKALRRKGLRQVIGHIGLFEALDCNFITQMAQE